MNVPVTDISQYIIQLVVSVLFAFLLGMEVYTKTEQPLRKYLFGTERTFAFIALLGFILLRAQVAVPHAFIAGFVLISIFLAIYYFNKVQSGFYGITIVLLALLIYTFPLLLEVFPFWLSMLIITTVMVLTEIKDRIKNFADQLYSDDFLTLAKFIVLTGVILPLAPNREIIPQIPVTPYKLWLAIVAISAISYLSYVLKKFVFPKAGLMMTAILGGLYSSTATTFILAKKSREQSDTPAHFAAAILSATVLMFIRIYVLVIIFNMPLSIQLLPYFAAMILISAAVAFFIYRSSPATDVKVETPVATQQNPLELRVAMIFGLLYIVFSLLTQYTIQYFGKNGLDILSLIVGVTDIDPFLLNIFQGKYPGLTANILGVAIFHAIASNNVLKMIYALSLGDKSIRKYLFIGFGIIIACGLGVILFL
jgi:uncharacterized membrane protein (DUF4010 family)